MVNYKIKNSSTYDGMIDDVNEKEWLKKVQYKKLKDDKYSAKPQPVIYFGDEDFRAIWKDYRTANLGEPHKLAIGRYLNKGI